MSLISTTFIGSISITCMRDGEKSLSPAVLSNLSLSDDKTMIKNQERACHTNFNAFLIQNGSKNLLVDTGCRDLSGASCGFLLNALEEAGVKPPEITDLFLTHMHPDHIAGAIDIEGSPVFKNATLKVTKNDFYFWQRDDFADETVNGIQSANLAKSVFSAYDGQLETLSPEDDIISGVNVLDLPGHTPGHSGFRIENSGNLFIHMGDILHVPNLQLANPNISVVFDTDSEVALKTRKTVFDMICSDKILCSGGHIISPRFGYLERSGSGYRFV